VQLQLKIPPTDLESSVLDINLNGHSLENLLEEFFAITTLLSAEEQQQHPPSSSILCGTVDRRLSLCNLLEHWASLTRPVLELSNEEACRGFLLFFFISLHLDLEDHPNPLPPFLDTNKTVPLQVPAVLNLLDDNPTPPQTFRGSCKLISREEEQDEEEETNSLVRWNWVMSFCCPKEIKLEDGAIAEEEEDSLKMRIWVRYFV
jgi:hypothetical protein